MIEKFQLVWDNLYFLLMGGISATAVVIYFYLRVKTRQIHPHFRGAAKLALLRFPFAVRTEALELGAKRGDRLIFPKIRRFYPTPRGFLIGIKTLEIKAFEDEAKLNLLNRKLFKRAIVEVVFNHEALKRKDTLGLLVSPIKGVKMNRTGEIIGETIMTIGQSYSTGDDVYFDYLTAGHTLISGRSGSGKSVLLSGLVFNAHECPQIKVCGIDKTGLILSENGQFSWTGGAPEKALEVVENLVAEMEKRLIYLRENKLTKIVPTPEIPLFFIVLEELSNTIRALESYDRGFKPAERILPKFNSAIEQLYAESRKAGFLLVAVAQKADLSSLPAGTRENTATFLTFNQELNSLKLLFSSEELGLARELNSKGPGVFLMGKGEDLELCQADFFV